MQGSCSQVHRKLPRHKAGVLTHTYLHTLLPGCIPTHTQEATHTTQHVYLGNTQAYKLIVVTQHGLTGNTTRNIHIPNSTLEFD